MVLKEAQEVIRRKFEKFGAESCKVALDEFRNAALDLKIVGEENYSSYLKTAKKLINQENDSKILAAALAVKADYLVTGDADFHKATVKKLINICKTREILKELGV